MGRFKNFVSRTYSLDAEIVETLDDYCSNFNCQKTATVEAALVDYITRQRSIENVKAQKAAGLEQLKKNLEAK